MGNMYAIASKLRDICLVLIGVSREIGQQIKTGSVRTQLWLHGLLIGDLTTNVSSACR
jgi:hypothetical protein